jgi:HlyD family secretion protein
VKIGQQAKVKVDALGEERELPGHVSEVGNSALNRSGGTATTTSGGNQEAKDFKVVITLDNPPPELRPGLSATATIITETRQQVLTAPIQALTIRELDKDGKPESVDAKPAPSEPATQSTAEAEKAKKKVEKEGIFTIKDGMAIFRQVKSGITGTTDIEIVDGLAENEQIITGPYQVLRTLKDNTKIKVEQTP